MTSTPPTLSVAASGHDIGLLAPSYQTVTISNPIGTLAEATPVTVHVHASDRCGGSLHPDRERVGLLGDGHRLVQRELHPQLTPATALMQGQSLPA